MSLRNIRSVKQSDVFTIAVMMVCCGCAAGRPVAPSPHSEASPAYALSRSGDLRLTLAPGWRQVTPESFGKFPTLALEHDSGSSVILAVAENAGTKTLDEIVLARRDYVTTLSLSNSLKIHERRYFFDVEEIVPCSLATYEYLASDSGDRMVQVVLTVIADGRAYEILGLSTGRKEAAEVLKPLITTLTLMRLTEDPS